jgi:flavin-dependent dehydrogenase
MSASSGAEHYDVAIVGASTAGCTAARLFAQRSARVALIERRPALDAYKTVCTHFIQSSAAPTIEELGLAPLIEQRGAVDNSIDMWTRASGWAFQSANWLVQETAGALGDRAELDAALQRYRRVHRRRLLGHFLTISDFASGRPINPIERRLHRAAARDRVVSRAFERVGSRRRSPASMLDPRVLVRVAR